MNDKTYSPKIKAEIMYYVKARQKNYLNSTEIYIPNQPFEKMKDGYELSGKKKISSSETPTVPTSEEEKLLRSQRRAFTAVKDLALSNVFELFVTFTFRANRFENEASRMKMTGWLKRQRKQDKDFQYVIVSELHKKCEECNRKKSFSCNHPNRPKALHFHALINGYKGSIVRAINPNTNSPLVKGRRKVYDFPNFTLGHSEVYIIGDLEEDRIKSGFYLLKYLKKDMTNFKGKKRYWASLGLNKPITIENPEEWYLGVIPDHMFESDYGKYLFFTNNRIAPVLETK